MITLFHFSDLHIGKDPCSVGSLDARSSHRVPNPFPTWCGHDERVAQDLSGFMEKIRKINNFAKIIISGDLTCMGRGLEFGCAHRYLHATWRIKKYPNIKIGLISNGENTYTIPGNHDFWDGTILNSSLDRQILKAHFWQPPWVYEIKNGNMAIHLVGLDSCSGLPSMSLNQVLANGSLSQEHLDEATRKLDSKKKLAPTQGINLIIRVVLLHHQISKIDPKSYCFLEQWFMKNNINIILSGHSHRPSILSKTNCPIEFVCGTTLQAGIFKWVLPSKKPNHFYMHVLKRVDDYNSHIIWQTLEWYHDGAHWKENDSNPIWRGVLPGILP